MVVVAMPFTFFLSVSLSLAMSDHESKMHQLQSLIEQLPQVNKETLKKLISHLLKLVETPIPCYEQSFL